MFNYINGKVDFGTSDVEYQAVGVRSQVAF
jgi:hypothetical protein